MDGNTGEVLELRETRITNKDQYAIDEEKEKGQNKDENKSKTKAEENEEVYTVNADVKEMVYELEMERNTGEVQELRETPITNKDQLVIDEDKEKGQNKDENKNKTKAEEKEKKKTSDRQKPAAKETESKKPSKQKTVKKEQERKETEEKSTAISIDEAVDIALSKFTGQVTEVEVEEEDGRLIYEVEIESGEEEAEIEIDAHTGEVIVIEIDRD